MGKKVNDMTMEEKVEAFIKEIEKIRDKEAEHVTNSEKRRDYLISKQNEVEAFSKEEILNDDMLRNAEEDVAAFKRSRNCLCDVLTIADKYFPKKTETPK